MSFFTRLSIRAFFAPRSRVRISPSDWDTLIAELGRRAGGVRESGAFLLAKTRRRRATVHGIVYFDDVDPDCLTGGITMRSEGFGALWGICSAEGMRVIADVHTHPAEWVEQSEIDKRNPMVATSGHVAIIVPHLAARPVTARECGVHTYRGAHRWDAATGQGASKALYIGRWA